MLTICSGNSLAWSVLVGCGQLLLHSGGTAGLIQFFENLDFVRYDRGLVGRGSVARRFDKCCDIPFDNRSDQFRMDCENIGPMSAFRTVHELLTWIFVKGIDPLDRGDRDWKLVVIGNSIKCGWRAGTSHEIA